MKLEDLNLPIQDHSRGILQMVRGSQVSIVEGATGSGKTTLLPYLMYRGGFAKRGKIACVLPTRPGAVLASEFVAELLRDPDAKIVGHRVRNNHHVTPDTKIVYMTDGIMARGVRVRPHLDGYSVVIIDEVHERRITYDFLLGYLKSLLSLRPDLKVILSSATMQTKELAQFFGGNVPVYSIPGRLFPVEVKYHPAKVQTEQQKVQDRLAYLKHIARLVKQIYLQPEETGHCLVFLPGGMEIFYLQRFISGLQIPNIECMPFHGRLERDERKRVFADAEEGVRKVILATNVAETSVTVRGVTHVIDSGLARETQYHVQSGTRSLFVKPINQSAAVQRAGRAGRTAPGTCHRMYSEESFNARAEFRDPAIMREDLVDLVFLLCELGVTHPEKLDLPTPITRVQSEHAIRRLQTWSIIDEERRLTPLGEKVAWLGGDGVQSARMVLLAAEQGVGVAAAEVAAYLSIVKFNDREGVAGFKLGGKHGQFGDSRGDPFTFLRMLHAYEEHRGDRQWCLHQGLNARLLEEALDSRDTTVEGLETLGYRCDPRRKNLEQVHRALVTAWGGTLCAYHQRNQYRAGALTGVAFSLPNRRQREFPTFVVASGFIQLETGVKMANGIAVPEDMVEQAITQYGDPNAVTPVVADGKTLRASGLVRVGTPFAQRTVRIDIDCVRSPERSLRMVNGHATIVEESAVPLRLLRISQASQIELARRNIMTLADCPKSSAALYEAGLPEPVCQEVVGALVRFGYVPWKPQEKKQEVPKEVKEEPVAVPTVLTEESAEQPAEQPEEDAAPDSDDSDNDWLFAGLLKKPVKELGLSGTTVLRLLTAGIKTVGDLADTESNKLRAICGQNERLADEVTERLEEFGIELDSGVEQRQQERMLFGTDTDMPAVVTEEQARKTLGDADFERFAKYRATAFPAERIVVRNELMCTHLKLCYKVAQQMLGVLVSADDKAISEDDLAQEGMFGLMTAIAKFNPLSGYRFSTYAFQWIKQAMWRMIHNQGVIRLPVHFREEYGRLHKLYVRLLNKIGREPTEQELADEYGVSIERMRFLVEKHTMEKPVKLEAPTNGKNGHTSKSDEGSAHEFGDTIAANIPNPEDLIIRLRSEQRMKEALDAVLDDIHVPAQHIVAFRMRHGLDGDSPMTLEQVGDAFHITRERIRQMEVVVFKALEHPNVRARLAVVAPWARREARHEQINDDQSAFMVVNEEVRFLERPEVEVMRERGAKVLAELEEVLLTLPVPERAISVFRLRHGLDGVKRPKPLTVQQIADRMGITKQRVSQIYYDVLHALYQKEVWERLRAVMPSLPGLRRAVEPFQKVAETGSADSITFIVPVNGDRQQMIRDLIEAVAIRAQLHPEQLYRMSRKREVVQARWLATVLLRDQFDMSFPEIGQTFGQDHSTVMHGYEQGKRLFGNVKWKKSQNLELEVSHVD